MSHSVLPRNSRVCFAILAIFRLFRSSVAFLIRRALGRAKNIIAKRSDRHYGVLVGPVDARHRFDPRTML
jgi:hypothetical protein